MAGRTEERRRRQRPLDIHFWLRITSPLLVLGAWECASRFGLVNRIFLPAPSVIVGVWVDSVSAGHLLMHVMVSLRRVLLGFLLGVSMGLLATLAMAWNRSTNLLVEPLVSLLYPIPKVAILPLLLIWLGSGDLTKIVVIATGPFFPVAINTYAAIRGISPVLIRAGRNLGANDRQVMRHIILPATLPSFFTGTILGAGLSFILLVYVEMTAGSSGVGYFTYTAATLFEPEKAFAGVFTLALLGWVWHRAITATEVYLCPWRQAIRE